MPIALFCSGLLGLPAQYPKSVQNTVWISLHQRSLQRGIALDGLWVPGKGEGLTLFRPYAADLRSCSAFTPEVKTVVGASV